MAFKRYFLRVVYVSVLCCLFEAISNADIGIISEFASQNGNDWVGPLSVACLFGGAGFGALYHDYITAWSYRKSAFLGGLGYDIFLSFSVMFLFIGFSKAVIAVIIIGSLVCGLMVSVYYNALNNYVNQCGKRDNQTEQYFGLNTCLTQASSIVGNGLSALLIKPLGQKIYSFVMLGLAIVLSLTFLTIKPFTPEDDSQNQQEEQARAQRSLITTNQDPEPAQPQQTSQIPKILYLCFALSGVMMSFVYTQFAVIYEQTYSDMDDEELNRITFITFMIEGCGQFSGGMLLAFLSHRVTSPSKAYMLNGLLFIVSVGIIYAGFAHKIMWMINVGAYMVGIADCLCFALGMVIAGRWNDSGIAMANFGQCSTLAFFSVLYIWMGLNWAFILYGVYFIISIVILIRYRTVIEGQRPAITDPNDS